MNTIKIGTYNQQVTFRPGETIGGRILWILDEPSKVTSAEVRLFWYTKGKGTRDVEIVDQTAFPVTERRGEGGFEFKAPASPSSFSGKLISLQWALELVLIPIGEAERLPITLSPTGQEILLSQDENTDSSR
jgi:hypothetical protein